MWKFLFSLLLIVFVISVTSMAMITRNWRLMRWDGRWLLRRGGDGLSRLVGSVHGGECVEDDMKGKEDKKFALAQ